MVRSDPLEWTYTLTVTNEDNLEWPRAKLARGLGLQQLPLELLDVHHPLDNVAHVLVAGLLQHALLALLALGNFAAVRPAATRQLEAVAIVAIAVASIAAAAVVVVVVVVAATFQVVHGCAIAMKAPQRLGRR